MRNKICLKTIFLAGVFLNPWQAAGADLAAFDQFTAAFSAGLFQGTQISSELSLESEGSSSSTQGVNVIAYTAYSGKAAQVALLEQGVTLFLSGGNNVVQGINVYRGSAESVTQLTAASGAVRLSAPSTSGSIQGVNVITGCDSCN